MSILDNDLASAIQAERQTQAATERLALQVRAMPICLGEVQRGSRLTWKRWERAAVFATSPFRWALPAFFRR